MGVQILKLLDYGLRMLDDKEREWLERAGSSRSKILDTNFGTTYRPRNRQQGDTGSCSQCGSTGFGLGEI